jgi:signal transduction histidine kinase
MADPAPSDGLSLRVLLLLGFGSVFALWLISAYALADSMIRTDTRSTALRTRFVKNEQLLSTVRAQALLSSVYLRDALLDPDPSQTQFYRDELQRTRRDVDHAMADYLPRAESAPEHADWIRLQKELGDYWNAMVPVLDPTYTPTPAESRAYLRDEVIPKRETIISISDQIHALNQEAFEAEQREVGLMRGSLQQRIWLTSLITVGVGLLIAFFAIRAVGRLDARVREQHRHEVEQKRELARLSSKLLQAQEDERRRIARELHDEIGQSLGALKLELAVAERIMPEVSIDEVLAEARSITDRTLQTVRDLSQLLHPAMLDDLGLPDTADWYLRAFSRRTGIASELAIDRLEERLAPEVEMCTYRVIQEAVTNVAKHSEATSCRVQIARELATLRIVVEDNGKGFQPATRRAADARGLGLIGVRERVANLGGRLRVESGAGTGTRLTVELPLSA